MSVTKPPVEHPESSGPPEQESFDQPVLALLMAVALAAVAGVLADWAAAVTVFSAVLALFTAGRR